VLSHVFEAAGLTTVALGSQRNQIERTAPPRGLFCDFPLGRPLGVPGDAAFQHRVLAHAFDLVTNATAPAFEIFAESIVDDGEAAVSCPLPPRHNSSLAPAVDEARGLRPAYDRAVAAQGGFGGRAGAVRGLSPEQIPDAISAFVRIAEGTPWKDAGVPGVPARVAQDIRGYYETAALALIEHTPAAWETTRWFLHHTEAGKAIKGARTAMQEAGEKTPIWFYLVPNGI
jgi:hypothetical protein